MVLLLGVACGLIAANIYYAQPLVGPISSALGLSPRAAGLVVTLTQVGYGTGLLLIVPLGDLIENRRLVLVMIGVAILGLLGAGMASHVATFLISALLIGLGSGAMQILVPYAAHIAPEGVRGRVVGSVMSGLLLGMMLARPVASVLTQLWSWRAVFLVAAFSMLALALTLSRALPKRMPIGKTGYGELLSVRPESS